MSGWCLIADERPPPGRIVLLWALTDTDTGNWKMAVGNWSEPNDLWHWDGRWLDKPYDTLPTHWQPLPEPPQCP